jgi:hypothetical protein
LWHDFVGTNAAQPVGLGRAPVSTMRAIFRGSATGEVKSNPEIPAAASISVSETVAAHTPIAPAAICRRAISGHLCALA